MGGGGHHPVQHNPLAAFAEIVFQFYDQGHRSPHRGYWRQCNSHGGCCPRVSRISRVTRGQAAPEGAPDFEDSSASLKRCPDTKHEFFGNLPRIAVSRAALGWTAEGGRPYATLDGRGRPSPHVLGPSCARLDRRGGRSHTNLRFAYVRTVLEVVLENLCGQHEANLQLRVRMEHFLRLEQQSGAADVFGGARAPALFAERTIMQRKMKIETASSERWNLLFSKNAGAGAG